MQEEHNDNIERREDTEQEIDLLELAQKLWAQRRAIIKWGAIGLIAGVIIAFSIPKEYTTTIKLAPEATQGGTGSGNLGALAALAGVNMSAGQGKDAVSPQLYPDIVSSIPFSLELFDVNVTEKDGTEKTVEEYVNDDLSSPWWSVIMSLPGKAIGGVMSIFKSDDKDGEGDGKPNSFQLTNEQNGIVTALGARVNVDVDTKTSVISISVTMQDPLVSAILADTVAERLKEYVTDYRTNKARADMEYAQKLNDEARDDYYQAQQRYANYMDKNQGVILRSMRNEEERLQNEMQLAYNLYNTTAQQLQMAKAKVQEITPVYAVLQPATVPLVPSKPSKMLIMVGCAFLAVVACSAWILFGKDIVVHIPQKNNEGKPEETAEKE
ncbi:MAG: chain-length determining protein [Paramuribaculum sp.]|nr:chain-length determining protein [Paramuribaculum sp.]